ncbi:ion transporter [Marinoscillum sp. MHG1-6]|uniref:ion transporter n=1 Tax=Marinoscillum sp. MHG1-6 TaxID=2959627 RepID=UPI002157BF5E|nr:ion transporter [Marinoscillum sp. MHG1-6]
MQKEDFKHFPKIRNRLYEVVFGTETPEGKAFDIVLLVAIILSIVVVMLESVKDIKQNFVELLDILEWTFTIIFSIEYFLRIFISRQPKKYIFGFFGIIDLIALLPTYISLFVVGGSYLVVIRAIRLLRIFRILKLSRYLEEAAVLATAMSGARRKILVFMGAVFTLVMITGTFMYLIEGGENGFTSIPRSIYWAVVTVTTVGYGDIAPQTVLGQTFATFLMLTGYAIIAVPTGIMTSEINKASKKSKSKGRICDRCETSNPMEANYCMKCGERLQKK